MDLFIAPWFVSGIISKFEEKDAQEEKGRSSNEPIGDEPNQSTSASSSTAADSYLVTDMERIKALIETNRAASTAAAEAQAKLIAEGTLTVKESDLLQGNQPRIFSTCVKIFGGHIAVSGIFSALAVGSNISAVYVLSLFFTWITEYSTANLFQYGFLLPDRKDRTQSEGITYSVLIGCLLIIGTISDKLAILLCQRSFFRMRSALLLIVSEHLGKCVVEEGTDVKDRAAALLESRLPTLPSHGGKYFHLWWTTLLLGGVVTYLLIDSLEWAGALVLPAMFVSYCHLIPCALAEGAADKEAKRKGVQRIAFMNSVFESMRIIKGNSWAGWTIGKIRVMRNQELEAQAVQRFRQIFLFLSSLVSDLCITLSFIIAAYQSEDLHHVLTPYKVLPANAYCSQLRSAFTYTPLSLMAIREIYSILSETDLFLQAPLHHFALEIADPNASPQTQQPQAAEGPRPVLGSGAAYASEAKDDDDIARPRSPTAFVKNLNPDFLSFGAFDGSAGGPPDANTDSFVQKLGGLGVTSAPSSPKADDDDDNPLQPKSRLNLNASSKLGGTRHSMSLLAGTGGGNPLNDSATDNAGPHGYGSAKSPTHSGIQLSFAGSPFSQHLLSSSSGDPQHPPIQHLEGSTSGPGGIARRRRSPGLGGLGGPPLPNSELMRRASVGLGGVHPGTDSNQTPFISPTLAASAANGPASALQSPQQAPFEDDGSPLQPRAKRQATVVAAPQQQHGNGNNVLNNSTSPGGHILARRLSPSSHSLLVNPSSANNAKSPSTNSSLLLTPLQQQQVLGGGGGGGRGGVTPPSLLSPKLPAATTNLTQLQNSSRGDILGAGSAGGLHLQLNLLSSSSSAASPMLTSTYPQKLFCYDLKDVNIGDSEIPMSSPFRKGRLSLAATPASTQLEPASTGEQQQLDPNNSFERAVNNDQSPSSPTPTSTPRTIAEAVNLQGATLKIPANCIVAITGPTGCGKSTLLKMLAGEVPLKKSTAQPNNGSPSSTTGPANNDGNATNAKDSKITAYGASVFMTADGFVFEGTLAENIAATSNMDEIDIQRMEDAMIDSCLDPVKFQMDTMVSGTSVSGGERLRISLARALYSSGNILLLDDPVSALDPDIAEEFISECLVPLRKKHTRSVIIATNTKSILTKATDHVIDLAHRPVRCVMTRVRSLSMAEVRGQDAAAAAASSRRASRRMSFRANNPISPRLSPRLSVDNTSIVTGSLGNSTLDAPITTITAATGPVRPRPIIERYCATPPLSTALNLEGIAFVEEFELDGKTPRGAGGSYIANTPRQLMPQPADDEELQGITDPTHQVAVAPPPPAAPQPQQPKRDNRKHQMAPPLSLGRSVIETFKAGFMWWCIGLVIVSIWRAVSYIAQRSLSDLVAKSPWLGKYESVTEDTMFYLFVFGNIASVAVFTSGMYPMGMAVACMKRFTFDRLLDAVEESSVAAHEAALESGVLMTNFREDVMRIDFCFYPIALFVTYLWFTLYLNYVIIEALNFAAIGVVALLVMWIALYAWYASREIKIGQVVLKSKAKFSSLAGIMTSRVFEIRSHGLQPFLQEKLTDDVIAASTSEYALEVWARYVELVADVVVSLFCLGFCVYVTMDLTSISEQYSMTQKEAAKTVSSRSLATFYAFVWKVTMSPLVIETNSIVRVWRCVGQIVAMAKSLEGHKDDKNLKVNENGAKNIAADGSLSAVSLPTMLPTSLSLGSGSNSPLRNAKPDSPFLTDSSPLSLNQVQMRYGNGPLVLKGLTYSAHPGTITIIKGSSGCGKSSMFLALLGLYPICGGSITLGPEHDLASDADWRRLFSWVPQEPFLFEGTIVENLFPETDPLLLTEEHRARAAQALDDVGIKKGSITPTSEVSPRGDNLSGGERQRVGIARALLNTTARVFIMDEPTSHLDSNSCTALLSKVKDGLCKARNAVVIVISHQTAEAAVVADQSIELRAGEAFVQQSNSFASSH